MPASVLSRPFRPARPARRSEPATGQVWHLCRRCGRQVADGSPGMRSHNRPATSVECGPVSV